MKEDRIPFIIDVESSKAQQAIHELEKSSKSLRDENKARMKQLLELESHNKKESEEYKNLKKLYNETTKQINANSKEIARLTGTIDVNHKSMTQLRKEASQLRRQLNDTVQSLHPEEYGRLEQQLKKVEGRMASLKQNAKSLKENFTSDDTIGFLAGTIAVKGIELVTNSIKKLISGIHDLAEEGVEMARAADGITKAFNELNKPGLLDNLREATKGTVNDVELMKAAVQANDFRIPLEDLGKYLAFAQLKAQQTGQSVDYMTNSIVTGLGRKSVMILDNLGLSAAEINEELSKTGDFAKAVATIVDNQLAKAGDTYVSAADRAAQRTVALQNAQKELGDALLPLKEEYEEFYGSIQIGIIDIIKWMVKYKDGVKLVTAAILLYVAATKAASIESEKLNTIMKRSAWGLVVVAIGLVVEKIISLIEESKAAKKAAEELNDVESQAINNYTEEAAKIKALDRAMRDERLSIDERKKALNDLKAIIPEYNGMLSEEGRLTRDNKAAIDSYLVSLQKEIQLKAYRDKLEELYKRKMQQEESRDNASKKYWDTRQNNTLGGYDRNAFTSKVLRFFGAEEESNLKKDLDKAEADLADTSNKIEQMLQKIGTDSQEVNKAISVDPSTVEHDRKYWQEQFDLRKKAFEATKKGSTEAAAALKELKEAEAKLAEYNTYDSGKSKNKNNTNTSKQDTAAADALKRQRQQELDTQQQHYAQMQRLWKEQLAKKAITQQEYDGIMAGLSMEHADCVLDIERKYAKESEALTISDGNKKKNLVQEQQRNVVKAEQEAAEAKLRAFEQYQQQLENIQQKGMTEAEREQHDRDMQLKVLEAYYKAALEYARQDAAQRLQVEEAYQRALAKLKDEWDKKDQERRFRARSQAGLTTETEELAHAKAAVQADTNLTAEERNKAEQNLEREHQQRLLQIRQEYGIARRQELYDMELQQLELAHEQELLSDEEFQQAKTQMRIEHWKQEFDYYSQLFGGAFTALQDAELETVRAKYDAEIDAARKAGKDTTALEEKKANEELKVQKKYADVNFAVKASQIIADTAVSIMKAYADLGPIAGSIAAALMGVTGAAQLAVAKAERDRVKNMTLKGATSSSAARVATGREDGGYLDVTRQQDGRRYRAKYDPRRRGYVDQPTVIVGEGPMGQSKEWVASNAAVENPTIRPVIDAIDQAQRAGNVRTLDLQKVLLQQGRQQGGYLNGQRSMVNGQSSTANGQWSTANDQRLMQRLTDVLERMEQEGIPALVGIDQVDAANELRNRSRRIAAK